MSGPNRLGGARLNDLSSLARGSRVLLTLPIIFSLCIREILELVLPISGIAANVASQMASGCMVAPFSTIVVSGMRVLRTKDCVLASSLSLAFSVAEFSVFMMASIMGDLVAAIFSS